MSELWTRIVAGIVAFLVIAMAGIGLLFSFAPETAVTSWSLMAALGLVGALAAYAVVERVQTGGNETFARQLPTRVIVLIPVAIAFNIVMGQAVGAALKLPVYLDSIGTILVAVLAGPIAGAITGLATSLLWGVAPPPFGSTTASAFALTAAVIGLMAGSFGRAGVFLPRPDSDVRQLAIAGTISVLIVVLMSGAAGLYTAVATATSIEPASEVMLFTLFGWLALLAVVGTVVGLVILLAWRRDVSAAYVVAAGVATGIVAAIVSAPVAANVFGGVTGGGTDLIVAALRQGGADLAAATLGQSLISDPIDKVITFFTVYIAVNAMSVRMRARFPNGDQLIAVSDSLDPAGIALGASR